MKGANCEDVLGNEAEDGDGVKIKMPSKQKSGEAECRKTKKQRKRKKVEDKPSRSVAKEKLQVKPCEPDEQVLDSQKDTDWILPFGEK